MAKRGRRVTFHGAFSSKSDAKRKERQVGGFIQPRTIRGQRRFIVMSENAGQGGLSKAKARRHRRAELRAYRDPKRWAGVPMGDPSAVVARAEQIARQSRTRHVRNPRPVKIYDGVVAIVARKGKAKNPKLSRKLFEHDFRTRPKMYGLPDGSLLITHRRL